VGGYRSRGLALLLILGIPGLGRAADWVVGANIGNVPWEFADARGQFVGFELDLVREAGRRLHRSVDIQNIPFNGLFTAVQSARIQIGLSSITITPKRLQTLAFAQPYFDADQSLCVPAASQIRAAIDLKGRTVGVDTASTGDLYATANQSRLGLQAIQRYEGLGPAMLDLAAGRLDGYLSDIPAVAWYIKDKPQFRIAFRIPTGERYSMMFARTFPDGAALNDAISAMKRDGFLARLHQTWFGAPPAAGSATVTVLPMSQP